MAERRRKDPRGRKPYDGLQVYLYVEAGRRLARATVKEFCNRASLQVVRDGRPRNGTYEIKQPVLKGEALRRRFNAFKKEIEAPGLRNTEIKGWDFGSPYHDELERLIRIEMDFQTSQQ